MTAEEFLTLLTQGAFGLVTVLVWIDYLRERRRTRLDIALVLTSLAFPLLLPAIRTALNINVPWLGTLSGIFLLSHPFLLLRLIEHFRPVPSRVQKGVALGFLTFVVLLILVPPTLPLLRRLLVFFLVAYLIGIEVYAARAFFQRGYTALGVARARLRLAAAGTMFIAGVLLLLGMGAVIAPLPALLRSAMLGLAFLAALSFYLGFVPPRWLRRNWQLTQLYEFLAEVAAYPADKRHSQILQLLCDRALGAVGGHTALIALWNEDSARLDVVEATDAAFSNASFDVKGGVVGQVWRAQQPSMVAKQAWDPSLTELVKEIPAEVLLIAPIQSSERPWGVLLVLVRRAALFSADDLDLLTLMGEQVAASLSIRLLLGQKDALVEGLSQANESLTQEVEHRLAAEAALQHAYDDLEQLVQERTFELAKSNEQLRVEIGQRERAVEELTAFTARLEQSNRELQDFAYIASHDLQEPLRKIQAFGDRLRVKQGDVLSPEGRDYLERMQNAAQRMQILINDLLDFSRVTTKAQPFVPVDLNKVVRDVVADLEARIEQTNGRVVVEALPTVEADPVQMRQLFQNLIGNALKFHADEAPSVTIQATQLSAGNGRLPHNSPQPKPMLQIVVQDNGIGFDEKYLDRIFNPFQRLHGRNEYEGTGIGLAICRKIVERHEGCITAKSAPGAGAAFLINLPIMGGNGAKIL